MKRVEHAGAARTIAYGRSGDQVGDLYLPARPRPAVICLIHGGYWRAIYDRSYLAPLAADLAASGFAVWSLEYRRVGAPGGGWPGTLQDVAAGVDHLATLAEQGIGVDLGRVATLGHSAGGQLALWCAKRAPSDLHPARIRIAAAVGLAPVADLEFAHDTGCGNGAVAAFLGGSPRERPERYRSSSPMQILPLGVPQLVIHGTPDVDVPVEISRRYAAAAQAAGDALRYVELAGAGHMDLVDPRGAAHPILCEWLALLRA